MEAETEFEQWKKAIGIRLRTLRDQAQFKYSRKDWVLIIERDYGITITESQIEKIENGKSFPGSELLLVYRRHYNAHVDFMLADDFFRKPDFRHFPDFSSIPALRNYYDTMLTLKIPEKDILDHLARAVQPLTSVALDSAAAGRSDKPSHTKAARAPDKKPPRKKSKSSKKRPAKKSKFSKKSPRK